VSGQLLSQAVTLGVLGELLWVLEHQAVAQLALLLMVGHQFPQVVSLALEALRVLDLVVRQLMELYLQTIMFILCTTALIYLAPPHPLLLELAQMVVPLVTEILGLRGV
jgi:hypothetical protein